MTDRRFTPDEVARYGRHITLREIGGPGQKALSRAKVLVVGAGGLGSPVLQYLGAAGVGHITVVDADTVEATNLQRQVIHRTEWQGRPKVDSAADAIAAQNPHIDVLPVAQRFDATNAAGLVAGHDLALDCCDDTATRVLLNATCVAAGVPLISAALTTWEGQISLYDPAHGGPCLTCVFPSAPPAVADCSVVGVLGPLPGIIGTMMAAEAIKALTGAGEGLRGRLLIYDALYADMRIIRTKANAECPVCHGAGARA
ncbi:Molybdenum cofactor synthesis protein 3 [Ketogulonicigenium robustum]|uniref:Molybdopterin-synthase adenylyltransferase n=1 Tax=Ketogulonicigenium robustum TaxID=92947 RepID=A0A1W6NX91_9RHOB|nr:Molybdenum cofactor synthesis protein 3 [Ketogulonicigenium robustum]